jgi:GNAT superfamily N-acetyltransferase
LTSTEILALYDSQMRNDPPPELGVRHERAGSVVRAVGRYNCILYSHLNAENADAAIAEQAAHFRNAQCEVEWKVYFHDLPADLGPRLSMAGFESDDAETLMAFDLGDNLAVGALPKDIAVRRIDDAQGLADHIAVNAAIWNHGDIARNEMYAQRLRDPSLGLYVAYADGLPVAAARLELPRDRIFAGLWGGCTLPAYRGRGIFRAIVAARAKEARANGFRFLNVDAAETSRPILERLGFIALCGVTGWRLKASPQ